MRYVRKSFKNERVELDGSTFIGCQFTSCKLVFRGQGLPKFDDCLFTDCDWVFDDAAELTLEFMAWMYRGLSNAGPSLIDDMMSKVTGVELFQAATARQMATVGD